MEFLSFLYQTVPGRLLLRPLTGKTVSRLGGAFLDTGVSRALIPLFIHKNQIDVSEYDLTRIHSFNDFFCRPLRPGMRKIDPDPLHLIAPCDALLSVHAIREGMVLPVKQSRFTLETLLRDRALAARYRGGICLVFRLCVEHYHRYLYADGGQTSSNRRIAGRFHTVRPVALRSRPVFAENTREYMLIRTRHFGTILQMEVGAMLVGRICNREGAAAVRRGMEKGCFQYGGSTILLLLEKGCARITPEILEASRAGKETPVRMGQKIGACGNTSIKE